MNKITFLTHIGQFNILDNRKPQFGKFPLIEYIGKAHYPKNPIDINELVSEHDLLKWLMHMQVHPTSRGPAKELQKELMGEPGNLWLPTLLCKELLLYQLQLV